MDQTKEAWKIEHDNFLRQKLNLDLKQLSNYDISKLSNSIIELEKYSYNLCKDLFGFKQENFKMNQQNDTLQELNNDLQNQLQEFENIKLQSAYQKDLKDLILNCLNLVFQKIGVFGLREISQHTENLQESFNYLCNQIQTASKLDDQMKKYFQQQQQADIVASVQNGEKWFQEIKNSQDQIKNQVDTLQKDLKARLKLIGVNMEVIDSSYQCLLKEIKSLILSCSKKSVKEEFELNKLNIVPKEKYESNIKQISQYKKQLSVNNQKEKKYIKQIEQQQKKIVEMIENSNFMKKKLNQAESQIKIASGNTMINEKELQGHLEILKLLQKENYEKNTELNKVQQKNSVIEKQIIELESQMLILNDQLKEIDIKNIGALRQERLKLDQQKQQNLVLHNKITEQEQIIKNQNQQNESFYKNIQKLKCQIEEQESQKNQLRADFVSFQKSSKLSKSYQKDQSRLSQAKSFQTQKEKFYVKTQDQKKLQEEIDNLKLTLVTMEIQISVERDVFNQFRQNMQLEKQELLGQYQMLDQKFKYFEQNQEISKGEFQRLSRLLEQNESIQLQNTIMQTTNVDEDINIRPDEPIFLQSSNEKNFNRFKKIQKHIKKVYLKFVNLISVPQDFVKKSHLIELERDINNVVDYMEAYISNQFNFKIKRIMEIFFVILKKDQVQELEEIFQTFGKVQKSQWVVIPFYQDNQVKKVFMVLIKIQINDKGIKKLQENVEIRKLIYWLSNIDQKMYFLEEEFHKIGLNPDQYAKWQKQYPDKDIIQVFEEDQNVEEKANRWFNLILFLKNISIDDKIMVSYLKEMIDCVQNSKNQIFIKLEKSQCLKEIQYNKDDSIFNKIQKANYQRIQLYNKDNQQKYQKFALIIKNYSKGFSFINQEKNLDIEIIKYYFIKQCSKQDQSLFFKLSELQQGIKILEEISSTQIWQVPQFTTGILKPQNIFINTLEEKYQNILQQYQLISVSNLIEIMAQKFIQLIQNCQEKNFKSTRLMLMLRYINFMLRFNNKFKYQKLINEYIALVKEETLQINLKKLVYGLELQHLSQMKNYNKIRSLKNKMETIDQIQCDFLLDELKQYQSKKEHLDIIDDNLLILQDFNAVGFFYQDNQLYLQLQIQIKTKQKQLVIHNFQVVMNSDKNQTQKMQSLNLEKLEIKKKQQNKIDIQLLIQNREDLKQLQYLYLHQIKFELYGIQYIINDSQTLKTKYVDLNKITIFKLQKCGFITKFDQNSIFFEETAANYYFIQFSLFKHNIDIFENIKIEIQKSSKFLLMEPEIYLVSNDDTLETQMIDWEVDFKNVKVGQYVLVLKIYILENKHKGYKLKLNIFNENKQYQTYLTLKDNQQNLEYLKTKFTKIKDDLYQLSLQNCFTQKKVFLQQISDQHFDEPICLKEKEEYSQIVQNDDLKYIDLVYQIDYDKFYIEDEIKNLKNKINFLKINSNGSIKTKIFHVESLMINHEVIIKMLRIKNTDDLKLYQQNIFILRFLYNKKMSAQKNLNLEIKYPKDKYIVIGTTRYELVQRDEEQEIQIQFLPIDSGYMQFPKLMLVEMRQDGSEHQHLLNDILSNKRFFVNESLIKATVFRLEQINLKEQQFKIFKINQKIYKQFCDYVNYILLIHYYLIVYV